VLRREQPAPTTSLPLAKDRGASLRVLVVDSLVPRPDRDSGSLRLYNVMRLARRAGMKVSFVAAELDRRFDAYVADLERNGIEVLRPPYFVSPLHALRSIGADLDLVVLSRVCNVEPNLEAARRYAPRARVAFDTVDLHYVREEREARLRGDAALLEAARRRKAEELRAARACDVTLVVSDVERAVLEKECPEAKVLVVSNIHEERPSKTPFAERRDFLFLGGFLHPPNGDAAIWFVREVLPKARPRLPHDTTFYVVGSHPTPEVRALAQDGVVVTGHVDDLAPWFERCRISVAPLRYGAGVKGKVNMSMAHGVPVVATSMAIEGMHLRAGEDALVADDADAFADAVVRLWHDESLWSKLAQNGRQSIREHFSFEAALKSIRALEKAIRA
jgi:glycosyltransferase involved in cell wall biosynthesis